MKWAFCKTMEEVKTWFGSFNVVYDDEEIEEILKNHVAPEIREEARKFLKEISEFNKKRLSSLNIIVD